ncbi:MAG TPA: ABC transporter ATP-binding protein [Symbiobacteriaceae bacterium]|nr:ABC transporter ATP-binding protein [Symbiobacteriaceae bacterium]
MTDAIRVQELHRDYISETGWWKKERKVVRAVDNLSFHVGQGEIFGLLGPNGAGKTTTIKIMTTLLLPSAGKVEVLGLDVARQHEELRSRIGVIFGGERSLYWRLSARENLQYFADLYRVPRSRQRSLIPELLEQAGLTEAADRRVESFSKGMKQRLTIVRGLVNDPEVLFLDEPTIGLDPVGAHELRQLVAGLAHSGKTIVLTTHYMAEAEQLCDRIGIIQKGKLVALDTPAELKRLAVGFSVVEAAVQNISSRDLAKVHALPGAGQIHQVAMGARLVLQIPTEAPDLVSEGLRSTMGGALTDLRVRDATLEDAYLRLVGGKAS